MPLRAKLIVVGGDAKAAEIKLKLPTVIGRGREASLTLPHPLVSRRHCELYDEEGKLCVRDLGSLNGTFVNNHRITESTVLPSGQLLTVGTVTFRAVYAGSEGTLASADTTDMTVRIKHDTVAVPAIGKGKKARKAADTPPAEDEMFVELASGAADDFGYPPGHSPDEKRNPAVDADNLETVDAGNEPAAMKAPPAPSAPARPRPQAPPPAALEEESAVLDARPLVDEDEDDPADAETENVDDALFGMRDGELLDGELLDVEELAAGMEDELSEEEIVDVSEEGGDAAVGDVPFAETIDVSASLWEQAVEAEEAPQVFHPPPAPAGPPLRRPDSAPAKAPPAKAAPPKAAAPKAAPTTATAPKAAPPAAGGEQPIVGPPPSQGDDSESAEPSEDDESLDAFLKDLR